MKTHRFLPVVASLFLVASRLPVPAGVEVDILSIDPRNPKIVLLQIHLNAALQEYEKVLAEFEEMRSTLAIKPDNTGLTDEQIKIRDDRARSNLERLDMVRSELPMQITRMLDEANQHAEVLEKQKLESRLKKAPQGPDGVSDKVPDLLRTAQAREALRDQLHQSGGQAPDNPASLLQGTWEGREASREALGKCTLEVKGDTVHFQGATPREWYKATFVLPDVPVGQPRQIKATITHSSVPEMAGLTTMAIYTLEDGTLTLVANKPGSPHPPKTFEGDPESRSFTFKQLVEH